MAIRMAKLRRLREEKELTQIQLAEMSGVHHKYISAIECFRRKGTPEIAKKLADALDVSWHDLFIEGD